MLTLKNNTKLTLIHGEYKLLPDKVITVPDNVGKIWLLNNGVIEYKDPKEAKAEVEELKKEIEKLKTQAVKKPETAKPKTQNKPKRSAKAK